MRSNILLTYLPRVNTDKIQLAGITTSTHSRDSPLLSNHIQSPVTTAVETGVKTTCIYPVDTRRTQSYCDVKTASFWRHTDVFIASCVCWVQKCIRQMRSLPGIINRFPPLRSYHIQSPVNSSWDCSHNDFCSEMQKTGAITAWDNQ